MPSEPEALQPELIAEEELRYLRRQRPVEIRRRKFGRRTWQFYKRATVSGVCVVVGGASIYFAGDFFLNSPRMSLASFEQIEVAGNHVVTRAAVLERFTADQGRSVLRVRLGERRRAIEEIPWVETASVERILPNRLRVQVTERTPVAFLRLGRELALVDAHGVILDRPLEGDFRFPVITGISEIMLRSEIEKRTKLYVDFLKEIELIRPGAAESISEVDLTDARDLRAILEPMPALGFLQAEGESPVLVHFGDTDFTNKFRVFVENISQWRASTGRVESVDLRFARQVVVNPETGATASRALKRSENAVKSR